MLSRLDLRISVSNDRSSLGLILTRGRRNGGLGLSCRSGLLTRGRFRAGDRAAGLSAIVVVVAMQRLLLRGGAGSAAGLVFLSGLGARGVRWIL